MVLDTGYLLVFLLSLLLCISADTSPDTCSQPIDNDCSCFGNNLRQVDQQSGVISSFGGGQSAVTGVILVMILLNIIVFKLSQLHETNLGNDKKPPASFSPEHLCRQFSLTEMQLATKNFDQETVIGKGGFGKVYKGVIDGGATVVAIKRLDSRSKQGATEFWTEIKMLSKVKHSNLVSLIGYCNESDEMMIVYEYISGGNLGEHLHKVNGLTKKCPLSWVERLKICVGAARALDYLHTGTDIRHRIIHRDVKSSNILLDDYMAAKVSDLGVSKIGPVDQPCTHVSTDVKGSFGYFDPNYFMTHRLTRKSDVYSLGVVLLEALCGRPALDPSLGENELGLVGWALGCIKEGMSNQIIDPSLIMGWDKSQIIPDCLKLFLGIVEKCLQTRPKERPTMTEVVVALEAALVMQERANCSVGTSCGRYENKEGVNSYVKSGKMITFSRMMQKLLDLSWMMWSHGKRRKGKISLFSPVEMLPTMLILKGKLEILL